MDHGWRNRKLAQNLTALVWFPVSAIADPKESCRDLPRGEGSRLEPGCGLW